MRVGRNDLAIEALRLLPKPLEEACGIGDLGPRFGERLALLGGHQARQIFLVGEHQVVQPPQTGRALLRQQAAP